MRLNMIVYTQVKCGGIWQFLHMERAKKLGLVMIDLKKMFPMNSSELIISQYFGSNSRKKKPTKIS